MYYIFLLTFGFLVPVSIIIISYLGILHIVCTQSSRWHGYSRNDGLSKKSPSRSELKTAQVVFSIIVCFLISWTPYAVCSLIGQFGDASLLSPLATALPAVFAKSSIIYNPFIYALSHPTFRTAFASLRAQYMGKRNSSGMYLHPRYHHNYLRPYHHNKFTRSSGGTTGMSCRSKTKLVVTAKGNGSCSTNPYKTRNGYQLDGQKMQFDGFKGKIPSHLLRHFTGASKNDNAVNSKVGQCGRDGNPLVHHQTKRRSKDFDNDQGVTISSCSQVTTPSTSFRCRHGVRNFREGMWVLKGRLDQLSDSEATARTAVPTHIESSASSISDCIETERSSSFRRKSILKKSIRDDSGRMSNSYSIFLCDYRKRRQDAIQQTYYRRDNFSLDDSTISRHVETAMINPSAVELGREAQETLVDEDQTSCRRADYTTNEDDNIGGKNKLLDGQFDAKSLVQRANCDNIRKNENQKSDDLAICCIDKVSVESQYDHSIDDRSKCNTYHDHTLSPKSPCDEAGTTSSFSPNNTFHTDHNRKHLNFIKREKASNGPTPVLLSSIRQKAKQDNDSNSYLELMKISERFDGDRKVENISALAVRTSNMDLEKVHEIVTGASNPKLNDCRTLRKSRSLSGLKVFTTESISFVPSSRIILTRKEKVGLFIASEHDLHKGARDERESTRTSRSPGLAKEKTVSSLKSCQIDIGSNGSSWHCNNPRNSGGFSSYEYLSDEDIDCSRCNSESSYASCQSSFNLGSLQELEIRNVEMYKC